MKKNFWKSKLTFFVTVILSLTLLASCGAANTALSDPKNEAVGIAGTVLLSVNPEIEVEYDHQGLVVELEGINADGIEVVRNYAGYENKSCDEVLAELVTRIYEGGYFDNTVDGRERNIVLKLTEGSSYPSDGFLESAADSVRQAADRCGLTSEAMTVAPAEQTSSGYIGLEKAKEIVISQLGLAEATFCDKEYELDDGAYKLEFSAGGIEYEYDVDARTGKVVRSESDVDDDYSRNTQTTQPIEVVKSEFITLDEAKRIALKHLGLSDARFDRGCELDDGKYELEFYAEGVEYEVDINARTGVVIKAEREICDDCADPHDHCDDHN